MRILLVSGDYPPVHSGEASHAWYLARHLARRGIDVQVLTSAIGPSAHEPGVTLHPLMRNWSWLQLPRLYRFVRDCAPDAILLLFLPTMYGQHPMITFAPSLAKKWLPSLPFVTQFENLGIGKRRPRFLARLARRAAARWLGGSGVDPKFGTLLRDSDRIVLLSESHANRLECRHPQARAKFSLLPARPLLARAPDREAARRRGRESLKIDENSFLLCFYGYFYPRRGIEHLLDAARRLAERELDFHLVLIGGPLEHVQLPEVRSKSAAYFRELKDRCREARIGDRVAWRGPFRPESIDASVCLYASDAFVFPSDGGVHLNNSSVAAAAAHELPIVATRAATTESAFRDRENAMLCAAADPEGLATAIEALVRSPALREKLAAGARALAEEQFSWDAAVRRTLLALRRRGG